MIDGRLATYDYGSNQVCLLEWLNRNVPLDIHHLTPVNHQELQSSPSSEVIVVATKPEKTPPLYHSFLTGIAYSFKHT